jgi:hypothetical protein
METCRSSHCRLSLTICPPTDFLIRWTNKKRGNGTRMGKNSRKLKAVALPEKLICCCFYRQYIVILPLLLRGPNSDLVLSQSILFVQSPVSWQFLVLNDHRIVLFPKLHGFLAFKNVWSRTKTFRTFTLHSLPESWPLARKSSECSVWSNVKPNTSKLGLPACGMTSIKRLVTAWIMSLHRQPELWFWGFGKISHFFQIKINHWRLFYSSIVLFSFSF